MMVKQILKNGFTGLCLFLTSCGVAMSDKDEFKWYATESAPSGYPMEIIRGTFFYKDKDTGLYIPSGGTLYAGWGVGISSHVTSSEFHPLPDRVEAIFFSYTEKQFYEIKLDLPYDRIRELFVEGNANPEKPAYRSIMLGIAPGGAVAVWLNGRRVKEILFSQAEKIEVNLSRGLNVPFDNEADSDAYIESIFVDELSQQEQLSLKRDGVPFGLWARYRNLYKWVPSYPPGKSPKEGYMVKYLNGESSFLDLVLTEELANTPRPLPRRLKFRASHGLGSIHYVIEFDELELMEAFEKLDTKGEKIYIEFDARAPASNMRIRVYNDEESIELKKTRIE